MGSPKLLSFAEAVLVGLAEDGGLFIPREEISREELKQLINRSYSTFNSNDITPLKKIRENLYILELFHGPTFAFKDVALQFLGNLLEFFLDRRNQNRSKAGQDREHLTVIGATSGDTGSAGISGLRGKEDISVFIMYPTGRI